MADYGEALGEYGRLICKFPGISWSDVLYSWFYWVRTYQLAYNARYGEEHDFDDEMGSMIGFILSELCEDADQDLMNEIYFGRYSLE